LKLTVVEAEPIRGRIVPAAQSVREFVFAGSIFRTSLADLATLTQNTVKRAVAASMAFLASPTHIQQRAFDVLGVKPRTWPVLDQTIQEIQLLVSPMR